MRSSFIEPTAPIIKLHTANTTILFFCITENSKKKGASFCQVRRNNNWYLFIFSAIIGIHIWKGAAPNFKVNEITNNSRTNQFLVTSINKDLLINITDPKDCTTKYFKDLSLKLLKVSRIMKPNRLTSMPNQPNHQVFEFKVIAVPRIEKITNILILLIIKGIIIFGSWVQ